MALKKVDFKQVLLEKGERIGLYAGLGVMALMAVLYGARSGMSEGPQAKVDTLEKLRKEAQMAYDSSQPDDGLDRLPPELNVVAVKPVNPELYPAKWAFFQSLSTEDRKWRQPAVLGPDEFQVDLVRGEVQIYIVSEDAGKNRKIGILKTKTISELTEEQKKQRDKFAKDLPGKLQSAVKPRRVRQPVTLPTVPGVPGAQGVPGAPGGVPAPGIGRPGTSDTPGGGQFPGLPGMQGMNRLAAQEHELKMVPVEKFAEENGILAQTAFPVRVLQVSAAFPYRAQLEEFRKALRFNSVEELFTDRAATPEFTGYSVQRRVFKPDGTMAQDWTDFDDQTPMRYLLARINPETQIEPEDPVLEADGMIVEPNRVVVPRPKLYGPPREYKWPEPKLEGLERAKDEIEKALKDSNAVAVSKQGPKSRFEEGVDLFELGRSGKNPSGSGDAVMPGRGNPLAGAGKTPTPAGRQGTSDSPDAHKTAVIPEKILVRFLDVTVLPGYSYEYRIKIRMANPNYDQPERAISNRLTKDKEIETGDWIDVKWKKDGQDVSRFRVSDELLYYVMQDDAQGGDGASKKVTTNKDQAVVQVQRWLETVRTKPEQQSNELPVGDWSILKERVVHRGEYVGKWEEVEVPAWIISQARYGLAVQPTEQKTQQRGTRTSVRDVQHKGIPVDFATDPVTGARPLVVDFEGGERTITLDGKPKKVHGPVEMLIYTADGKLALHHGPRDSTDPERQKRFQEWEQWLNQVKNQGDNPNQGGPNDLFSPRKPKSSGGG